MMEDPQLSSHHEQDEPSDNEPVITTRSSANDPPSDGKITEISWPVSLKGPTRGEAFSPSCRETSLHGIGVLAASNRLKQLTKKGCQGASMVHEVASHYETFSHALSRASGLPNHPKMTEIQALQSCLSDVGIQLRKISTSWKTEIAKPLHASQQAMSETVHGVQSRYTAVRKKTHATRNYALKVRSKYIRSIQDAETAVAQVLLKDTEEENYDAIKSRRVARAQQSLRDVRTMENQYHEAVEEENRAVNSCNHLETVALQAMQLVEEQRISFVEESIWNMHDTQRKVMSSQKEPATKNQGDTSNSGSAPDSTKKSIPFFQKFSKPVSSFEEGISVMEAETLGLPEQVGKLRDEVKTSLRNTEKRILMVKALAACLEEVASAASTVATAIMARLVQDQSESFLGVLKKEEGTQLFGRWERTVTNLRSFADASRVLAKSLRTARQAKLDNFVLRGDRDFKTHTDTDDNRWRILCDAARTELKAQSRFDQSTAQSEKARERVQSCDNDDAPLEGGSERANSPVGPKMAPAVSKALGNVFSILPNGGESAMKIMGTDARKAIAKTSLDEAAMRVTNSKRALDSAMTSKEKAIRSYTALSEKMICMLEKENSDGWDTFGQAVTTCTSSLSEYQSSWDSRAPIEERLSSDDKVQEMAIWTTQTQEYITSKAKDIPEDATGYMLTVQTAASKRVTKLLTLLDEKSGSEQEERKECDDTVLAVSCDGEGANLDGGECTPDNSDALSEGTKELMSLVEDLKSGDFVLNGPTPSNSTGLAKRSEAGTSLLKQFLPPDQSVPKTSDFFICAYWPNASSGHIARVIHGILFVTETSLFVVDWSSKKLVFEWDCLEEIVKCKALSGLDDDAIIIKTQDTKEYFFGCFSKREELYQLASTKHSQAKQNLKSSPARTVSESSGVSTEPLGDDPVIKKMSILLEKKLENVTVKKFYETVWSEGQNTSAKPLYGPWLADLGSQKINVGEWQYGQVTNPWSAETMTQKRVIRFEFKRTTHLYLGPPIATVVQTHYCNHDENFCVLQMTVEVVGIPMADSFAVEVRWVATRVGEDLKIQVGVFVNFKKSMMLAKQIRNGALVETKPIHEDLFQRVKAACSGEAVVTRQESVLHKTTPDETKSTISSLLGIILHPPPIVLISIFCMLLIKFWSRGTQHDFLLSKIDTLESEVKELRMEMQALRTMLGK